jgi:hypothetical protein
MYREDRNPFFNVVKEPLFTASGLEVDKVALINQETQDVLGVVAPTYEVVENSFIRDLFNEAVKDFGVEKCVDHLDSNTKRWKRHIIMNDDRFNHYIQDTDMVGVLIEAWNGFTGKVSFGYNIMGFRWACTNGLITGKEMIFSESYSHAVNNPEKLAESFVSKFNAFGNVTETWKKWAEIPFTKENFTEFVEYFKKPSASEERKAKKHQFLPPKVADTIVELYPEIMARDTTLQDNKWGAFNVLTNISTHKTEARKGSNVFSTRYATVNRLANELFDWKI